MDNSRTLHETSPRVNGFQPSDISEPDGPEDLSIQDAIVDGSVGSDTDTGKLGLVDASTKDTTESQDHMRSNSFKKPATFKAVSVTKNFLAKAGTVAPTGKSSNEKGDLRRTLLVI